MLQTLKKLQGNPALFRRHLFVETDGGIARFSDVLAPFQRDDFSAMDGGLQACIGRQSDSNCKRRCWLERPRGHSKTTDIAIQVMWALFAAKRRVSGVVAAADKDQARLLRNAIAGIVQRNSWLREVLDVQQWLIRNKHTNSEVQIISGDVASSWGLLCDFIVCDEVSHWAKPDLWQSLLSTAAKKTNCALLAICNAGWCDHWAWETREHVRTDENWHFNSLDGPQAPWISESSLAEQQRLLPDPVYRRLWENEWALGSGNALNESDIAAAVTQHRSLPHRIPGLAFVGGVDLSVSRDDSAFGVIAVDVGWTETKRKPMPRLTPQQRALVDCGIAPEPKLDTKRIQHPGTGRLRLADLTIWKPQPGNKINLEVVEKHISNAHQRYGLSAIAADQWQAELLCQRLQRQGVPIQPIHFVPNVLQQMATSTLDAFRERRIDLYEQPELLADLRALQLVERHTGFRLQPQRKGDAGTTHGDAATALMLALFAARRFNPRPTSSVSGKKLVCHPLSSRMAHLAAAG